MSTLTPLETRLLAALKALAERCVLDGVPNDSQPALTAALDLIAECEPEPIPVGEAQDSDFGAFQGAAL
jgi:hypothetical protein